MRRNHARKTPTAQIARLDARALILSIGLALAALAAGLAVAF